MSTRLAPVHVECSKVMLTPLSMSKLQPNVCKQLSRPKRAHSASQTKPTVKNISVKLLFQILFLVRTMLDSDSGIKKGK